VEKPDLSITLNSFHNSSTHQGSYKLHGRQMQSHHIQHLTTTIIR